MNSPEIFTYIDLEMNQPSGNIIQIGAIVANVNTGEVLERASFIVRPTDELSEFIINLTGITKERIEAEGTSLEEAYIKLHELHKKHKSFINPVTWGGGDSVEIHRQLPIPMGKTWVMESHPWPFGRRWIDVKTLYVNYRLANGKRLAGGLAKAMTKVGLAFEGRKHDAEHDAYNTFRMHRAMLQLLKKDSNGN